MQTTTRIILLFKCILLYVVIHDHSVEALSAPEPTPSSIPLPDLPDQFRVYIEGNLNENQTTVVEENYDGPGNRGSAMFYRSNVTSWVTYDLLNSQRISVSFQRGMDPVCNVTDFTNDSFTLFRFHTVNGTVHVGSAAQLFVFGKQFNETYLGQDVVRGIPVNHWVTTIPHDNGTSADLHYYFSVEGYHAAADGLQVPVRATLNGTSRHGGYPINHVYEFFDMHVGLPLFPRVFEIPLGLSCVGRLRRKELPKFPDVFSFTAESFGAMKKLITFSVFFSFPANTTAAEYVSRNGTRMKIVHDFSYGLSYRIFEENGTCVVSPIDKHSPDAVLADDGVHVSLHDPTDLFINRSLTWVYEGVSTVRGLLVESWISEPYNIRGRVNATTELFFASVNESAFPGFAKDVTHFLVRRIDRYKRVNSTTSVVENVTQTMDMYSFNHEITGPWHFETSACFEEDNQTPVAFDLEGEGNFKKYVQNNSHNFHHGIYESILNATNLTSSRIAHVMFEEGKDEVLTIFFTILGVPKVQGNAVNSTQNHSLPLDQVVSNLEKKVDMGDVHIVVKVNVDQTVTIPVKKGSFRVEFGPRTKEVVTDTGISVGLLVGIAVLTLVIGIVIGVAGIIFLEKKFSFHIPYQTQE